MQTFSVQSKAEAGAFCQAAFEQAGIAADTQMLKEAAATLMRLAPKLTQEASQPTAQPPVHPT
jgi:hypothetical protein